MKTLIVYASQNGSTADCVNYLQSKLDGEVTVKKIDERLPKLDSFDTVIVGGSVHMGKIQRKITSFCRRNKRLLLEKNLGLFVCCYTAEGEEGFLESIYDEQLLSHAVMTSIFGGEMRYERLNFAFRKLFESLNKVEGFRQGFVEPEINYVEIEMFAKKLSA
ncbi:flavodoxin domain-containing protein [Enterococcus malodoratus]|uniref:flavodoxin domain-containing protein n=1 Tax=Enterococcus malodoratus TaxID=71451 RepID=UPI0039B0B91E